MPYRSVPSAAAETKLARARIAAQLRQHDTSEATGSAASLALLPLPHQQRPRFGLRISAEGLIKSELQETWFQLGRTIPIAYKLGRV